MDLLRLLRGIKRNGKGWTALCPAHPDKQNSLSVGYEDKKWLLCCHAGCKTDDIVVPLGLQLSDLFDDSNGRGEGVFNPSSNRATAQPSSSGLNLADYAKAKALPVDFLTSIGLGDVHFEGRSAVRIPYYGLTGEQLAVRFR